MTGCDSIVQVDLTFQEVAEGTYIEELCDGESTTVNGTVYTETNTTDEFIIPNGSINGCDSLVRINITFFENSEGSFLESVCAGDTIMVNGEAFYEGKETGSQLLSNAQGCDSLVNISIDLIENTEGLVTETICSGDTIIINGEAFFEGNETASQLLAIPNAQGCDSTVQVNIEINDPATSEFTGDYCASFSIDINGITYNQMNPSGMAVFENMAANGCDSIVTIDLTFDQDQIDSTLNISTCDDGFSIVVGGETFDISNSSGMVDLIANDPEACDTSVSVNIVFGEFDVDYVEIDEGCSPEDVGGVIIETSSGTAPYNIIYNGNNVIAFSLPINIDLPAGTGEISITDDAGCEVTIPYEIFPAAGDNFSIAENDGQIIISGGIVDSIAWTPSDGLSCLDCIDPFAQPDQSTIYTATIYYGDSCVTMLSIEIEGEEQTNNPDYVLPSVFSPNGDNTNDNFLLTLANGATGIPERMSIYDRWGNQVYSGVGSSLLDEGWDGTFNGKDLAPGVYVYQLNIIEEDRVISIYGDVTLIR